MEPLNRTVLGLARYIDALNSGKLPRALMTLEEGLARLSETACRRTLDRQLVVVRKAYKEQVGVIMLDNPFMTHITRGYAMAYYSRGGYGGDTYEYTEVGRLIRSYKYGFQEYLASELAACLEVMRWIDPDVFLIDLITPVPSSKSYNHMLPVASALADKWGRKAVECLRKASASTESKEKHWNSAREKREAIRGQIYLLPHTEQLVANRKVLLVDDVFDTGSTADESARVLKTAGATAVYLLALAKDRRWYHDLRPDITE